MGTIKRPNKSKVPAALLALGLGTLAFFVFQPREKTRSLASIESRPRTLDVTPITPVKQIFKAEDFRQTQELDFAQKEVGELYRLEECYEHSCEPNLDERSQFFTVGQKIKASLLNLAKLVKAGGAKSLEISKIARDFLKNPDGHVQEAALDLISTQPVHPENLEAILTRVVQASDAELIHQAMLELKRYDYPQDQARIQEVFGETLQTGPPFVALAIAEHLGDFMTAQSFLFYSEILKKIDGQTMIHKNLLSALKEFVRMSSAG
jgi:hypothetical protein